MRARLPMLCRDKRHVMDQLKLRVEEFLYAYPSTEYAELLEEAGFREKYILTDNGWQAIRL